MRRSGEYTLLACDGTNRQYEVVTHLRAGFKKTIGVPHNAHQRNACADRLSPTARGTYVRNSLDLHRFGGVLYYTVLNQHAHERSKTNVGAARAAGAGGAASEGRLGMGATAAAGMGEHHLAEPVP